MNLDALIADILSRLSQRIAYGACSAHLEIEAMAHRAREHINRSAGQRLRRQRERMNKEK